VSVRVVPTLHRLDEPLGQGELDLAWVPRQAGSRAVVWGRLFDESFTFVVRRGHPVTRRRLTLDRFCALRHVALAPASHSAANPVDARLARLRRRRDVVATVPNFLAVPALLERSDVAAILPRRIFDAVAARYRLAALELPFELDGFSLEQAWHERSRKDAGHAWFRQRVAELAKTV
jgi:DNA-binding transcriptional LysR family regulator